METLTKKQIENILAWIGKSYPVDLMLPEVIEIDVLTEDFCVHKTTFNKKTDSEVWVVGGFVKVIAWRHTKHK